MIMIAGLDAMANPSARSTSRRGMRVGILAGVVGPLGFLLICFSMAALRSDLIRAQGWSSWPSSMALGGLPGVPQEAAFLLLAVCYPIFAARALRPGLASRATWMGFIAVATGDVLLTFPTDYSGAGTSWHGAVHYTGVLVVTVATLTAAAGVTVATRRQPAWRAWRLLGAPAVLVAAIVGLIAGGSGWGKLVYVLGITMPVPLIAMLLARQEARTGEAAGALPRRI